MNAWERIQSDPEVDRSQIYPVPCERGLNDFDVNLFHDTGRSLIQVSLVT